MREDDWLAARFEENRDHLRAVAYRMLGSQQEAEDAVQESWIRLSRSDPASIDNLGGWLTTVVGRICLDMLRLRRSRPEQAVGEHSPVLADHEVPDPELEAVQADSVGLALLVVLETLTPAERLAFVLHDMFAMPFDDIAPIVGRSPAAARQLASRARRRVQGNPDIPEADSSRQREIVSAFLAASRSGDFEALLEMLDPEVVVRADEAVAARGAASLVRGAAAVAEHFSGRALAARLALVDGLAGAVWAHRGVPQVVFAFTISEGRIAEIEMLGDDDYLEQAELTIIEK
ncbi:RNA polymerase sigma-70 factor (ECF subfamily) [Kribbella orskensis]|uniref:RNA polymerase sigma-70 factor (ECF subfamily) n=1 Tax=Kribbella orskensis TaxID=2512216 RepID=A0ABY2BGB8_9ACTN|nr:MULTISPECIES: sigma-70 family RNA polymerase sigma factor [Kribbella]TCN37914.1 RNA polymerase sigma-70 factor (ECF subfamily) [Kribbella sp. VKM Ac-2500]TCO19400.1 RNA polymerase sigma-70 factor (ECF subfamily) [Kribbella orskensis]